MTEYTPEIRKAEPGNPDTVLGYDGSGNPEFTLKSSLGSIDIDTLPAGTADDKNDLLVISDQSDSGNEKSISIGDLEGLVEPTPPSTYGAIGTYIFGSGPLTAPGGTATGITAAFLDGNNANPRIVNSGSALPGTWRCMGFSQSGNGATLWLRIS
jgi:hypothetical protein